MNHSKRGVPTSAVARALARLRADDRLQALVGLALAAVVLAASAPLWVDNLDALGAMLGAAPR